MPLGNWNLQWLGQNSQRAYPIADWGTKRDKTNTIILPDSFIVEFYLPIHSGLSVQPERFFLRDLGIFPTGYNIGIGYDNNTLSPPLIATANIPKATHTENRSYAVGGVDSFNDTVGHITIGALDEIDQLPPGLYTFAPAATPLEVDTIRPIIRGVAGVAVVNGTDRSPTYYGDIELIAGSNMRIAVVSSDADSAQISFSAISGEGLNATCACDENITGDPIRFINGIPPLQDGNFRIVGDDCIELVPIANGIKFTDSCSKPCCGCDLLDPLTRQIDRFADGAATLRGLANTLQAEVVQMRNVVLGSRLADQGCIDC
jgi:hypothetical protein